MQLVRLDDYQTWLLGLDDAAGRRHHVLVDPWLTPRFCVGWPWVFGREHRAWVALDTLPRVDAVLVSAHFADHCDLETLTALDPAVPIYTTKTAARLLRRRGRERVEVLGPDQRIELAPGLVVHTIRPGFPYAHNSLGFLVHEQASDRRAYVETHVTNEARLRALRAEHGPIDLVVAPVESVRLFGIGFAMAGPRALRSAELVDARWLAPTGLEPSHSRGLLRLLLRCRGDLAQFRASLAGRERGPELLELAPGRGFVVPGAADAEPLALPVVGVGPG